MTYTPSSIEVKHLPPHSTSVSVDGSQAVVIEIDTPHENSSSLPVHRTEFQPQDMTLIRAANSTSTGSTNSRSIRGANRPRMGFDEAVRRILDHGKGLGSERVPMSQVRVVGDRIFTKDREFLLESEGLKRLCRHFSAPADYLEKLPARLRDPLLSHHLSAMGKGEGRLNDRSSRVIYREGTFIDVARSDLHTLGSGEVLNAVRDGFGSDSDSFEVQGLEIDQEAFCLDIVSPRVATEVRRGDVIQAGVRLEHSYTGERATSVTAFVARLQCSNGMVHRQCLGSRQTTRTRRLNADREDAGMLQIEQIKRMTQEVREKLGPTLDSIRKLADQKAEVKEMDQFLRQARMHSSDMATRLRDAWVIEGSEQTAFGLFNAMTRLATHDTGLSARQRGMLARLAGIYANRSTHICPHCFSVRNAPSTN